MTAIVRVAPAAARRIRSVGHGRTLLIGFYASRCCTSTLVGDLNTRWLDGAPSADAVEVAGVEGTQVMADRRLVDVLGAGGACLVEVGLPFNRSIGVRLDDPSRWLEFLESPAARRGRFGTSRPGEPGATQTA